MKMLGYSERGILNSLLSEIQYHENGDALLNELIGTAEFPANTSKPLVGTAMVLVEQSLSEFGDADAIVLIESDAEKCAIFVEAKVAGGFTLSRAFKEFESGVKAACMPPGFSSNIFTQLYHKQRFAEHSIEELQQGVCFPKWSFTETRWKSGKTKRTIGNTSVVLCATKKIKPHCNNTFYLMLIPDGDEQATAFFENVLWKYDVDKEILPDWDASHYGYLTWKTVESFCCNNNLKNTLAVFKYNGEQIYKKHK